MIYLFMFNDSNNSINFMCIELSCKIIMTFAVMQKFGKNSILDPFILLKNTYGAFFLVHVHLNKLECRGKVHLFQ